METTYFRTTAYRPAANGMVVRYHRQLKAAIRCHNTERWTEILPTVILGIRSAWKDLQATVAEMLYGESLRLPGTMLVSTQETSHSESDFVKNLRKQMRMVRPVTGTRHGEKPNFRFKEMENTNYGLANVTVHRRPQIPQKIGKYQQYELALYYMILSLPLLVRCHCLYVATACKLPSLLDFDVPALTIPKFQLSSMANTS
ncbi:uncharacterized protein LOC113367209 [Ctenocephalides felis]|uniref:uncharacterized protein LOC113367209 n=1 Tax=Ctenocephalides felis TaxID=7515 RepID=UPI000E6E1C3D|nr:uncharacterized protein LOC113367209 [Ctenocephalides felis]